MIVGPVAFLIGKIIEFIYNLLSGIGIENIGLCIIILTIVVYILMLPLTIRQQRFSKLQVKMQPELKALQEKYKGKKDERSMMAQQQEMNELYAKYGVSPTGSCLPLVIQMPILFALYRVIYAIPAYIGQVKDVFSPLAKELLGIEGSNEFLLTLDGASMFKKQFENEAFSMSASNDYAINTYIDVLNRSSTGDWSELLNQYPQLNDIIDSTYTRVASMNNFLGLNIGNAPRYLFMEAWADKSFVLILVSLLIPLLAIVTQMLNYRLMPQAVTQQGGDPNDPQVRMQNQMKVMNTWMPVMSGFFCFTLPAGLGLYWISSSVVRSIQQVIINHRIDLTDLDAQIAANTEKYKEKQAKKQEKDKDRTPNMKRYATMNTRSLKSYDDMVKSSRLTEQQKTKALEHATELYESGKARKGSLLKAANMVREYNEKNTK